MDMTIKEKLYNSKHSLDKLMSDIKIRSDLTPNSKAVIKRFYDWNMAKGLSYIRIHRLTTIIKDFGVFINKDLDTINEDDLIKYISYCINEKRYKPHTLDTIKNALKVFLKFLKWDTDTISNIECLKRKKVKSNLKREDLLSEEEVKKILSHSQSARDRAIISMAYEMPLRPGEIRSIRLKDVIRNSNSYKIYVEGKTGRRELFFVTSMKYIDEWLNNHPKKDDPNSPLFCNYNGSYLSDGGIIKIFKVNAKRAGINKRIYPYIFRHSAITRLSLLGVPESLIKRMAGQSEDSNIISNYQHLISEDVEQMALQLAGIKEYKKKEDEYKAKYCVKCGKLLSPTDVICSNCDYLVEDSVIKEEHNLMTELFTPEELREFAGLFLKSMAEMIEERLKNRG